MKEHKNTRAQEHPAEAGYRRNSPPQGGCRAISFRAGRNGAGYTSTRAHDIRRRLLWWLAALVFMSGCCGIKECAKGFAGVSTKALVDALPSAASKTISLDYAQSVEKTLTALREINAYIYANDHQKKLIALYVSSTDTTPVGIFFYPLEGGKTEVRVSSPSAFAKASIAQALFSRLEKSSP